MIKKLIHTLILLFLISPLFAQVNLSDQLLLHYNFSGNTDDNSGNNINGTAHGDPTLTTDRFGNADKAYFFNGTDDYISIPSATIMPDEYSYSLWANPASNDGIESVLSIGDATTNQSILLSFVDGWLGGSFLDDGTTYTANTPDLPELNKWYHIVLLRTKDKVSLYVDDTFIGSEDVPNLSAAYGIDPIAYLARRTNGLQYFKGKIDDVRIYARVINEDEIKALFEETGDITSIEPANAKMNFEVSPNPSAGKFKVELAETNDYEVIICNALGETIYNENFKNVNTFNIAPLEKNGIYYLNVKSSKGTNTERIVVTNQ